MRQLKNIGFPSLSVLLSPRPNDPYIAHHTLDNVCKVVDPMIQAAGWAGGTERIPELQDIYMDIV